jgi:flagellar biosynthetic protein FliR
MPGPAAADSAADAALVAALPGWAFAFVLVLSRVSATVILLPGLGETGVPAMVRAGLAAALTLLLLPAIAPLVPAPPGDLARDVAMIGAELLFGLTLGLLARLVVLGLVMAGQIVSLMTGLSNVLNLDPELGSQSAAVARLMGTIAPVLVLASGLYAMPLEALAASYGVVAPGSFLSTADAARALTTGVAAAFDLALRLAGPFVIGNLLWQVGAGALARLVPQLQVHFAAMPGQILGGLVLLGLLTATLLDAWQGAARDAFAALPGL